MPNSELPSNAELASSVVSAIRALGGFATNEQIRQEVIRSLDLSPDLVAEVHSGGRTRLEYKLAWARTIAKQRRLIESSGRMAWKLIN
jgi:restriction system protein